MIRPVKYAVFFIIGGLGYALLELSWRGRTHWTMVLAGGICFVIFSLISERFSRRGLLFKSLLCAVSITAVEFIFGLICNVQLHMNVWDYSEVPYNLMGQICPPFFALWWLLGLLFLPLADMLNRKMKKT
ncbi:MAG: hypothetical protein IJW40_11940 [Clostridia bacterium]|nr:hypothetical protein [Clostridia bacterium]MBQ7339145.1 hypothetical protein [Clostridia bacterium]